MRAVPKTAVLFLFLVVLAFVFVDRSVGGNKPPETETIAQWHIKWDTATNGEKMNVLEAMGLQVQESVDPPPDGKTGELVPLGNDSTKSGGKAARGKSAGTDDTDDGWTFVDGAQSVPSKPDGVRAAWIKFELPELGWTRAGLMIDKLYSQNYAVVLDGKVIQESRRSYLYEVNKVLLPLTPEDSFKSLYIRIETSGEKLGIESAIRVGDHHELLKQFMKQDLIDVVLGSAFIFFALMMLICSFFLKNTHFTNWLSLSLVILALGLMVITYSPFLYTFFGQWGDRLFLLFDISLLVFLPALTYFFETVFGSGKFSMIRLFRIFQISYSFLCILLTAINEFTAYQYEAAHYFITVLLLGVTMIIQFVLLVGYTIVFTWRGNKDAIIFTSGFAIFAAAAVTDLVLYYSHSQNYDLVLWKFGVVGFVVGLIAILGRSFARDRDKLISYSSELELYNNRLQRSEKMQIISELAASVAHEVRNPLQVTRGFLQLLGEKSDDKEKAYMKLALEELDRAANIITDFLTFAKPELEHVTVLQLCDELKHIEGILVPLANLQGGEIELEIPSNLYIRGNSAKLKQALINIVKNSIEALEEKGTIRIWAYEEFGEAIIHIKDNGIGMGPEELAKLGEPYYSNKTKGTGLGLMVTFRIIEVMQGKLQFRSEKGMGTEAIIRFPSVLEAKPELL
ncbi:sensor histidine kinase [Paenibacillus contaminans]|uniref:histidine kinase n=1 Tax=Paenibacillus contaminans TaxID=450362 RepID=A0A329LUT5_9BACL|nr:sensor histidine kinase [Paenibacillus contaminans]RAV11731.1 sensor histidine kinase [Paenibacillus contaminans]